MTNFVYEGLEVKKTGRIAQRTLSQRPRAGSKPEPVLQILVEIEPVDNLNIWKKWVNEDQLFSIKDN